jgi:hypothetical protein
MGECRVCKVATMWDGTCIVCFKTLAIMTAKPVLFVPKTRVVYSRKKTLERDKVMARMMDKDKEPYTSNKAKSMFWIPEYTGEDSMAKIKFVQARNPFWNVPRAPEGQGSFIVAEIKSRPIAIRREKSDKSGYYDTTEMTVSTKVQLGNAERLVDMTFKVQDSTIGGAINQTFPVIPGRNTESCIGKFIGVFYDETNSKGWYQPDMYIGASADEVIADLNTEHRDRVLSIMGVDSSSDWSFSFTAWTPTLSEYLQKLGATDDIPF